MKLNRGRMMRKENKEKKEGKSRPKDSGSAERLEQGREREVTSVMAVNLPGIVAAKILQGIFSAMARGDSGK